MQTVADDGGNVGLHIAERTRADAREDAEALALQVLEALAGLVPVVTVGTAAVRIDKICVGPTSEPTTSAQRSVSLMTVWSGLVSRSDVAPGVGCPNVQPVSVEAAR